MITFNIAVSVSLLSSEVLPVTEEQSQEGSTSDVMGTVVSYGGVKAPFFILSRKLKKIGQI